MRFMSIIFPEQIGKRPIDKKFPCSNWARRLRILRNGKRRDEKLFLDGGKTERILLENRSGICLSTKRKTEKRAVLEFWARVFGEEKLLSQKLHKTFLRREKYGKNETIHINSFRNEQFFIPKGQIRAFFRKMHLILYSIWFNM